MLERNTHRCDVSRRDEGHRDRLGEARTREHVGHEAALPLGGREPADTSRGGRRDRAPDVLQSVTARHLLHEVDLALEVGAPRGAHGNRGVGVGARLHLDAERREQLAHGGGVEFGAEDGVDACGAHRDSGSLDRLGIDIDCGVGCVGRSDGAQPLDGAVGTRVEQPRSGRCRGARSACWPPNADQGACSNAKMPPGCEVGRLEQDLGGAVVDLTVVATHDPGDGLRGALGVADQQFVRGERAVDSIERDHVLALVGQAHHEPTTGEPTEVEGVERPAGVRATRSW